MNPMFADAIDFPLVLMHGLAVLVPLLLFQVGVEALVLRSMWSKFWGWLEKRLGMASGFWGAFSKRCFSRSVFQVGQGLAGFASCRRQTLPGVGPGAAG